MTGGAFTPQARDFLANNDRPHLEKPFTEHDLLVAIDRVRAPAAVIIKACADAPARS